MTSYAIKEVEIAKFQKNRRTFQEVGGNTQITKH